MLRELKQFKSKKAFTLIELIVVIAIIGILMAILIPSLVAYIGTASIRTAESNAKTAHSAIASAISNSSLTDNSGFVLLEEDDVSNKIKAIIDTVTAEGGELGKSWEGCVGIAGYNGSNINFVAVWAKDGSVPDGTNKYEKGADSNDGSWAAYPTDTEWSGSVTFN